MANPERGEVDVVIGEKTYTLRPTMNALCAMQKRTGQTYGQLLDGLDRLDVLSLREVVFTYLQPYHAKEFKTLDQVGDLMDLAGGYPVLKAAVIDVLRANVPPEKPGGAADPQTTQAGTGAVSGETRDGLA